MRAHDMIASSGAGPDVIAAVVSEGMCIGCGACVGVCPNPRSAMHLANTGLWEPTLGSGTCPAQCGRCASACPFGHRSPSEADIGESLYAAVPGSKSDSVLGRWSACYAGFHPEEAVRRGAASGGVVTGMLETALRAGVVDVVANVGELDTSTQRFHLRVVRTPEGVRASSSSRYFPVHYADVMREIASEGLRAAVVALPCQAKALRLAAMRDSRLREGIVLLVGLACGQMKNARFTRSLAGGGTLTTAEYRVKDPAKTAYDYSYRFTRADHGARPEKTVPARRIGPLWESRWQSAYPCCFCDDIFAECADVCAMDAWTAPYSDDGRGTTLLVVRSEVASAVVGDMDSLHRIESDLVLASQESQIRDKRIGIGLRTRLAEAWGLPVRDRRLSDGRVGRAEGLVWTGAFLSAAALRPGERRATRLAMQVRSWVLIRAGRLVSHTALVFQRFARGNG